MLTGAVGVGGGHNPQPPGLVSANLLVLCLYVMIGIGTIHTKFLPGHPDFILFRFSAFGFCRIFHMSQPCSIVVLFMGIHLLLQNISSL